MEITGHIENGAIIPDQPVALPDGARVRVQIESEESGPKPGEQRKGGWWRGQVHIADDFDELPEDIARAFGMLDD